MKQSKILLGHKIIVVGCPGSGKSYMSKALSKITEYPLYHLDMLYWNENWVETPIEIFKERIKSCLNNDNYIIDGNYKTTFDMRFENCDTVVFMDLPTRVCLRQELSRRNTRRSDFPEFLEEKEDKEFIKFIKDFRKSGRKVILEYIKKYSKVTVITIKSTRQMDKCIQILSNKTDI